MCPNVLNFSKTLSTWLGIKFSMFFYKVFHGYDTGKELQHWPDIILASAFAIDNIALIVVGLVSMLLGITKFNL